MGEDDISKIIKAIESTNQNRRLDDKFAELFNKLNQTNLLLVELSTKVKILEDNYDELSQDIKTFMENKNNEIENKIAPLKTKVNNMSDAIIKSKGVIAGITFVGGIIGTVATLFTAWFFGFLRFLN